MKPKTIQVTLNGKKLVFTKDTKFLVQVGRYDKGSYKTRYSFKGAIGQAIMYFNGINIGNGYKKRLMMNNRILARAQS